MAVSSLPSEGFRPLILQGFRGSTSTVESWTRCGHSIYFSINGSVASFTPSEREGLRAIPISRLLVESNSPNSPVGVQYPMTPVFLGVTIDMIARIRGVPFEEICRATYINGLAAFQALLSPSRPYARR
ncbi:hypothetical protein FSP39_003674 [Pinctada imbricata]|uniref:Uncharacterized protein n=1 Tax=Pinctada imbricata TaxID=66713 RepID=A0AA88XEB3_PINIB|nr:hypothetical protein FSP39_003674 [Pinctada imbricata]